MAAQNTPTFYEVNIIAKILYQSSINVIFSAWMLRRSIDCSTCLLSLASTSRAATALMSRSGNHNATPQHNANASALATAAAGGKSMLYLLMSCLRAQRLIDG